MFTLVSCYSGPPTLPAIHVPYMYHTMHHLTHHTTRWRREACGRRLRCWPCSSLQTVNSEWVGTQRSVSYGLLHSTWKVAILDSLSGKKTKSKWLTIHCCGAMGLGLGPKWLREVGGLLCQTNSPGGFIFPKTRSVSYYRLVLFWLLVSIVPATNWFWPKWTRQRFAWNVYRRARPKYVGPRLARKVPMV